MEKKQMSKKISVPVELRNLLAEHQEAKASILEAKAELAKKEAIERKVRSKLLKKDINSILEIPIIVAKW